MIFLVDTNVLVYALTDTRYRAPCQSLIELMASDEADGWTSVVVIGELWHLELRGRPLGLEGVTARYLEVFPSVLGVDRSILDSALGLGAAGLGAADRIIAATCLAHGVEAIVTADAGFDGVAGLRRVDPLDRQSMEELAP